MLRLIMQRMGAKAAPWVTWHDEGKMEEGVQPKVTENDLLER